MRSSKERFCGNGPGLAWRMHGRTGNGWVGRQLRPYTPRKSGNCTAPASANPRSPAAFGWAAPPFAESWRLEANGQAVCGGPVKRRKQIEVGERVSLELTERDRDLIMKHTFADSDLTDRLRILPSPGRRPFYRF